MLPQAGSRLLLPQGHSLATQPSAPSIHCFSQGWEPRPDTLSHQLWFCQEERKSAGAFLKKTALRERAVVRTRATEGEKERLTHSPSPCLSLAVALVSGS